MRHPANPCSPCRILLGWLAAAKQRGDGSTAPELVGLFGLELVCNSRHCGQICVQKRFVRPLSWTLGLRLAVPETALAQK